MDFFAEQDQARRHSKRLVCLFVLAVFLLILLTNGFVAITIWLIDGKIAGGYSAHQNAINTLRYEGTKSLLNYFSLKTFGLISTAVIGTISCAIAYKWAQLSAGGKRIAESLDGIRLHPNTTNANEKQLLNVVEEIAIASGMPVPAVYLLKNEQGINAFAAGNTPADAVIGITQGSLAQFDRTQLQGVIAHEFSHILNGDMRLNVRLIALLHGIVFVGLIGEILLRGRSHSRSSRSRGNPGGQIAVLGVALVIIGWLGNLFGRMIKSAVSRQRELLADASAVQFTRNPQGIADALKIIGGYEPQATINNTGANEVSHLFFGEAIRRISSVFVTHPPLDERIKRIEPQWNGQFIFRKRVSTQPVKDKTKDKRTAAILAATVASSTATTSSPFILNETVMDETLENICAGIDSIPDKLNTLAHEPFGAIAITFGLLLNNQAAIQDRQLDFIRQMDVTGLDIQILLLIPELKSLPVSLRLPLIELCLPALKCMSPEQYSAYRKTLLLLIRIDKKLELFEWCLFQLVCHYLNPEFNKPNTGRPLYKQLSAIKTEYQLVLSLLAHHGHSSQQDKEKAFHRGANTAGGYTLALLDENSCQLDRFSKSVEKLANCYPLLKPRLLKGLADCARQDGIITPVEKDIITVIAAVIDCPMPRL